MNHDAQKAEALQALAAVISHGLPGLEYHEVPMHTCLFFRAEADRQNAIDAFKHAGHTTEYTDAGCMVTHIGGNHLTAGISVSLIVPTIDLPDEDTK
ncbi:hypothetical protein [Glutamicibacter creatinolyticus]|uniref:hypothetical protein n=1 Tax=Glutamicibacter creatinolyticus TaxID=162496 RepID=UPI003217C7E1